MYNGITRMVEAELFPCLRRFGLRFYAYNPLGGGMLTGKHSSMEAGPPPEGGRFSGDAVWAVAYRNRYWKAEFFAALDVLRTACDTAGISMANASLRWLAHHSKLDGAAGDGIIIGASSIGHLESNLEGAQGGPLPKEVVDAMDEAETLSRKECPCYFR